MIIALASVVNYDRQSDAPIWSATSSGVNYDRNKFIIQATGSFELDRNGPEINLAHSWSAHNFDRDRSCLLYTSPSPRD